MAEQFYAKKDYSKAQVLYEDIFQVMKGTPRYEDMYYKFAYSYYYQKDYSNAENLFKNFLENDEKILICTHATLRFAFEELDEVKFNNI
jgi:TolA-binding protein